MWAIVALSAVGGVLSAAEPAGWLPADILWRAGFAALVAGATAKAVRWTWVVLAAVAAAAASGGWLVGAGLVALGLAVGACVPHRRSRPAGALVGAIAVQVLLRIELDGAGASALVAAVAVMPVFVSGYLRSGRQLRRRIRLSLVAGGGLAVVAAAGLAYAGMQSQQQLRDAADEVRDGLDALRNNEPEQAVALLAGASEDFEAARQTLDTWGRPARVVPVLGHQARAVAVVAQEGAALASTAADATVQADIDELRFDDGVLDLELVAGFEAPLAEAYDALAGASEQVAEARTMWLVDPLASAVADFGTEVDRALPDAELAIQGVRLAPALFGGDEPRHYFIAFTQPAESRGLGGFVGNYGELTAIDGDIELTRSGPIRDLIAAPGAAQRTLSGPADYLARYGRFRPAQFLQDLTVSPDGPSVARVMEELYPQAGGQEVDGTIIVDPVALAALMEFTGPIPVTGWDVPLTSDNAADILIRQQYLTFQEDEANRKDFLDEATRETFEALTTGDLPAPRQLADVLGPVVHQGRLIVHSVHDDEQALMERTGLDGALPPVEGDFLSVTTQNGANNKIDVFLGRTVDYRAVWDPATGGVEATATVELHNGAPASGLPDIVIGSSDARDLPPGTNLVYVSLYSALSLTGAEAEEVPIAIESQRERDRWVYSRFVEIPPGGRVTLRFHLQGTVATDQTYRLGYAPQPLVNPDRVRLRVRAAEGWVTTGATGWERTAEGAAGTFEASEDEEFSLEVTPN